MSDKTLAEIAKAFKGSFIYAPGGTVNIGCNIFEGPATPKKPAPKKAESGAEKKSTSRRKSTTKVDEKVEPPKGESAPPTPVFDGDDDDEGDAVTPTDPAPPADADPAPFKPARRSRRRRSTDNGA